MKHALNCMLLTLILMLVGTGNVWGETYTITFKTSSSDGTTTIAANANLDNVISEGKDYISGFTSNCSKAYYACKEGIKLGSDKADGTVEFNLATVCKTNITKITLVSAKYNTDSYNLIMYADNTLLSDEIAPGEDYVNTFDTSTTISTIKISTSSKRAYISQIIIETDGSEEETPEEQIQSEYELFTSDLTEGDYIIVDGNMAMTNTISSNRFSASNVTITNNIIKNPDNGIIWHISQHSSQETNPNWKIYSADVQKYAAGTGIAGKIELKENGATDGALWTVSGNGSYHFLNRLNSSKNVNAALRYNSGYGFACYAPSTGNTLKLYKKKETAPLYTITVIAGNGGIASSNPRVAAQGTAIQLTAEANTNHKLLRWTVLDAENQPVEISNAQAYSCSFTMPASNVTATAEFALKEIESISATLDKVKYKVGDALDLSSLQVTVVHTDGSREQITSGYTSSIANGTALTTSDTQITITYNSKSKTIPIYVLTLDKIEITTDPTKMNYLEGELFDNAGMVVKATWGTGDKTIEEEITDYTWSPATKLSVESQTITISYTHQGTTKTTTLNVTVTEKPSYTVTINEPANGTITVKNGDNTISSGSSVKDGTTLNITVTPAEGYKLDSWTAADGNEGSPHTYTESGDYTISGSNVTFSATFSEITTGNSSIWILTPLSELTADDVFLIVDKTSGTALSQEKGTESVPDAVAVELNEDKTIVTLEDATYLTWNVDGNATDGYTFYVENDKTRWLYAFSNSKGVRVGNNENVSNSGKSFLSYSETSSDPEVNYTGLSVAVSDTETRYVGVYNNSWRCYTLTDMRKNIHTTQIGFYRRAEMYTVTIDDPVGNGTISVKNGTLEITSGTKVANGTGLKVTATPASDDYKVKSLTATDADGEHKLVSGNVYTINGSNVTFSVEFAEKQFFTITFVMNGHDDEDDKTLVTSQKEGEYMEIPTVPDYRGKVHFGWVSEEITNSQEYPALANVNGKSRVVENATYYAVYATRKVNESEGAGTSVVENSFVNGNYYILDTYQAEEQPINYYAMTGAPVNNKVTATIISDAITVNDDGTVTLDEENEVVNALMVYNITKDTESDGYTIKNVAHNKLVAASTSSNSLNITNKRLWSLDWDDSGNKATFLNTYSEKDKSGNPVVKDACLMLMATNWDSEAQEQSINNAQMFKDYLVSHRKETNKKGACYGSGYLYLIPAKYSYFDFITDFVDVDITVSAYEYTTYSSDKAYKMPEGLTGRTVYPRRQTDAGYNLYVPATYPEGSFVPVGESLLLQGTANETYTLMQWGVPEDPKVKGTENCLYGEYSSKEASGYKTTYATGGGENADESDKYYYYKLTTKTVNGTKNFGWYWGVEEGKPFYMSRNDRAYLVLPKEVGNNIKGWIYDTEEEEIETGIDSVTAERTDDIYDLSGRRIKGKLSHGIYIMDGKKYMVK